MAKPEGRASRQTDKPNPDSVAEHDQISEVYHVLSGTATLVLGPDIVNRQRRSATMRTVVEFNGPGNNGSEVRDGIAYEIKAGDVVVIPAGTGSPAGQFDWAGSKVSTALLVSAHSMPNAIAQRWHNSSRLQLRLGSRL